MALRPEDIDVVSLEEAIDWLEERSVCYDMLETHGEILDLIRAKLKDENPSGEQLREEMMSDFLTQFNAMRCELSHFYAEDLKTFVKDHLGEELRAFINNIYTDIDSRLERNLDELINSECAIVVAGETSAGKSSFINLLMGADVLPHSILANTLAICHIHNSDQKQFQVVMENAERHAFTIDGDGLEAEKDFVHELSSYIGRSSDKKVKISWDKIKHVDIYWPVPLLKKHVTVVDTPGVGESPEMAEKLVKYLPNAAAFIYVINSANAGGIQEDTILQIISEQKKLDTDLELSSFDTESMIFICNKWDIVEKRCSVDETWQDTVQRLQRTIPDLKEDHIFKLSVTEALKYRRSGIGNTKMYQCLLERLELFVPGSLMAKVKRHYRWLVSLLSKLMTSVASRINNARKSAKAKEAFVASLSPRLIKLETSSEEVRSRLTETAKKECQVIVQELHKHLAREDIISYLQTWTEEEAPEMIENDIEFTRYEAQRMIIKRLLNVIQTWEKENRIVESAVRTLTRLFKEECFLLSHEFKDVDEIMKEKSLSDEISLVLGGQQVSESTTEDNTLEAFDIAIIAASSPIWVPIDVVALVLGVPVAMGYGVIQGVKNVLDKRKYKKNKAIYMQKLASECLPKIESLTLLIEMAYLQRELDRVNYLCDQFIPNQIKADETHMLQIAKDNRSAAEIIHLFQAKKDKLKGLYETLYLFDLKYLANDAIGISRILRCRQIGSGSFSDVYRATLRQTNGDEKEVALKILKDHDMYLQLSEVDCSRRLKHHNIVEFYGVVIADRERYHSGKKIQDIDIGLPLHDDRLTLILDLCEQSLESLVFGTTTLQCGSFPCNLRTGKTHHFFFEMAVSICEGLEYMHCMKFLHRDLKLSNVLVKNGVAKLCDLGFARAEVTITGTAVESLTHMAPELFKDKFYDSSSDVYSLGTLLWELWYGKRSYSDAQFSKLDDEQFMNAVIKGARPDCELEHTMLPGLKTLVEKCWGKVANSRPNVEEVKTRLKQTDMNIRRNISS